MKYKIPGELVRKWSSKSSESKELALECLAQDNDVDINSEEYLRFREEVLKILEG